MRMYFRDRKLAGQSSYIPDLDHYLIFFDVVNYLEEQVSGYFNTKHNLFCSFFSHPVCRIVASIYQINLHYQENYILNVLQTKERDRGLCFIT